MKCLVWVIVVDWIWGWMDLIYSGSALFTLASGCVEVRGVGAF